MPDQDSARFFNVEQVAATQLDALLSATEREGHRLIHLRVERRAGTTAYVYTPFFKRGARARTKQKHAKKGNV
jgi:hypothetical protein